MTPDEKAEAAKRLMAEPVMKAAFADIREVLVERLESVPMGDVDTQYEITLTLQILKNLQTQLGKYIGDQALRKHRLKQEQDIEKRRESLSKLT